LPLAAPPPPPKNQKRNILKNYSGIYLLLSSTFLYFSFPAKKIEFTMYKAAIPCNAKQRCLIVFFGKQVKKVDKCKKLL
jgi:hypothetical protein